jgi:hypothetical protein
VLVYSLILVSGHVSAIQMIYVRCTLAVAGVCMLSLRRAVAVDVHCGPVHHHHHVTNQAIASMPSTPHGPVHRLYGCIAGRACTVADSVGSSGQRLWWRTQCLYKTHRGRMQ